MTYQSINLGALANDGTGDDLRTAFTKVNSNFLELYSTQLSRTLVAGSGINLTEDDGEGTITIAVNLSNVSINTSGSITAGTYFFGNLQGNVLGSVSGTVYAPIGGNAAQGNVVGINGLITNMGDPNYSPATVDGISIQGLDKQVNTFNFGNIVSQTFSDPISYLLSQVGLDMGSFINPAEFNIDGGLF